MRNKACIPSQKTGVLGLVINKIAGFLALFGVRLFKIKTQKLVEEAKAFSQGCDQEIFGPQKDYVEGIEKFCSGINPNHLSGTGAILINMFIHNIIETRKKVCTYIQSAERRDAILAAKLDKPIIITGLGRTGSTFLYNLLSCDPKSRAPYFFELSWMANPVPPTASREARKIDPRIKECEKGYAKIEKSYPNFFEELGKSHNSKPDDIEEELVVLFQCMLYQLVVPLAGNDFRKWYEDDNNKEFAYRYLRMFLQMMNQQWQPESHWVLKAPIHSTYMNAIGHEFPDARFIFTHRHPKFTVPSWARLLESYLGLYLDDGVMTYGKFGKYISESLQLQVVRMYEFKKTLSPQSYSDIEYDNLVRDPIGTVKSIYNVFGLEYSQQFEENMKVWMANNQQGKHGRAPYSLERYLLNEEDIQRGFKDIYPMYYP